MTARTGGALASVHDPGTVRGMATRRVQLPLTEEEIDQGRALERKVAEARAVLAGAIGHRNAWFLAMDRKYRGTYHRLPSAVARLLGLTRWAYMEGIEQAAKAEQGRGQTA